MEKKIILTESELKDIIMDSWVAGWQDYNFSIERAREEPNGRITDDGKRSYTAQKVYQLMPK